MPGEADRAAALARLARATGFTRDGDAPITIDFGLADLASEEGVAPLLGARLASGGCTATDRTVRQQLLRAHALCELRNRFLFAQASTFAAALLRRGISPLLLKGAALARTTYDDAGCRPMADVDLLVQEAHWADAVRVATESGALVCMPDHRFFVGPLEHEVRVRLAGGGAVDLHQRLFPFFCFSPRHDAMFARARREADGMLLPAPSDLFVHIGLHAAVHGYELPFRAAVDALAMAARGLVTADEVVARAAEWRGRTAMRVWIERLGELGLIGADWPRAIRALGRPAARAPSSIVVRPEGQNSFAAWRKWWRVAGVLDGPLRSWLWIGGRAAVRAGIGVTQPLVRATRRAARPA